MPTGSVTPAGGGGGLGTVTSVSSANTAITVATPTTTPALTLATLDVIAADGPAAANWSNNSKKITAVAAATAATDAASLGNTLDQFGAPAANVAFNSKKITGLAAGSGAGDSLRYEQLFTAGAVPIADIADPTTGKVIGSSGGAATAVLPPGFEIGYTQITATVNVVSTTEATGTTILSPGALTFDGGAVLVTFFGLVSPPNNAATDIITISLFEAATQITELFYVRSGVTTSQRIGPVTAHYRFTPSAASHTYTITGFVTNTTGTPRVEAGAGGTGADPPAFVRFSKV